ncbi:hypothetical protein B879_03345 [Cecembia lonarensis LW9]|uniref:Uncharacterized protein n=1 Tax=Cecembia lonarensis (strain CCUG 58316 / KCTC 22772 / LW9) TaxID=1225176 RepID=K1KZU7_CECL9|nr:hypothetical protein B879_03345 [Cecembia lonarensis LW9]
MGPGQPIICNGFYPGIMGSVQRNAKNFKSLIMILIIQPDHIGIFLPTRPTPSRPKIYQYIISPQVRKVDGIAIRIRQRNLWCHLPYRKCAHFIHTCFQPLYSLKIGIILAHLCHQLIQKEKIFLRIDHGQSSQGRKTAIHITNQCLHFLGIFFFQTHCPDLNVTDLFLIPGAHGFKVLVVHHVNNSLVLIHQCLYFLQVF